MKAIRLATVGLSIFVFGFLATPDVLANEHIVGSGKAGKVSRKVGAFHAVSLSITADLIAAQGAAEPVVIEGDDNILAVIKTEVKDGILFIDCDKSLNTRGKLTVRVKTPKLDQLTLKGTGSANVSDLNGPAFNLSCKGTSSSTLSGKVDKFTADVDGTGTVQAIKLIAKNASVAIKGTGTVKLTASDTLNASIKGTGTIKFAGNPKLTQSILGIGSVSKI